MLPHMLLVAVLLVTAYFIMDSYYYRKEGAAARAPKGAKEPLKLDGIHNFLFLAGIVGAVLLSGRCGLGTGEHHGCASRLSRTGCGTGCWSQSASCR